MKKNGFYLNIVFLGDEGVGKSKYLNSFLNNKLVNMEDSLIGINMEEKKYIINYKQKGILNLIDTAGQDKFKGKTKNFYEKGDGFIIFSSFLIKESIKSIFDWIENIYQYKPKELPILNVIVDGDKVEQETKDSIIDEELVPILKYQVKETEIDSVCDELSFDENEEIASTVSNFPYFDDLKDEDDDDNDNDDT